MEGAWGTVRGRAAARGTNGGTTMHHTTIARAGSRVLGLTIATALAIAIHTLPAHADVPGQPREAVVAQYQSVLLPALKVPNDWSGSTQGCSPGGTGPAYQQATLTAINYVRGLVGQPPVGLDAAMSAEAQAAALIMAAQGDLDHFPPDTWACWTPQGRAGASRSNLYLGRAGADAIVGYMDDPGSNNTLVGHRRWIIDSRVAAMGTGDTSRTNALAVIGGPRRSSTGGWLPWPANGYFPWQLEPEGRWSLGLPGANFDAASVSVSIAGQPVPVSVTPPRYGYGDNTISWDMTLPRPTKPRHPEDMNVDVTVSGIRLGDGSTVTHSYTVNLVDAAPHTPPAQTYLSSLRRAATTLTATWAATEDDGGEQVSYVLTATPLGKAAKRTPARTCTTADLTCTLTRLDPKASYRVSLVARNALGDSAADTRVAPRPRR